MEHLRAEVLGVDGENKSVYLHVPGCVPIAMVDAPSGWFLEAGDLVEVGIDGCITGQVTESESYVCQEIPSGKKRRMSDDEGCILMSEATARAESRDEILSIQDRPITSIAAIFQAINYQEDISEEEEETTGEDPVGVFQRIGLKFEHIPPLEQCSWADWEADNPDQQRESLPLSSGSGWNWEEDDTPLREAGARARELVNEDTGNARSLSESGPTSLDAAATFAKIIFPCQGETCDCRARGNMYTLVNLMPTLVGASKKDLCFHAYNSHMHSKISKKQFKIMVAQMRLADKYAITLTEDMKHSPIQNLIFNSYKSLKAKALPDGQRLLKQIKADGYSKIVLDMIRNNNKVANASIHGELSRFLNQTLTDVVTLTLSARKALGEARLTTLTKSTEFMRMIFGDETTQVAAGGGYYCQDCFTQPKYDFHWSKAINCGKLGGWFCGAHGPFFKKNKKKK